MKTSVSAATASHVIVLKRRHFVGMLWHIVYACAHTLGDTNPTLAWSVTQIARTQVPELGLISTPNQPCGFQLCYGNKSGFKLGTELFATFRWPIDYWLEMPGKQCCSGDCKSESWLSDQYPDVAHGVFCFSIALADIKMAYSRPLEPLNQEDHQTSLCVLEGNAHIGVFFGKLNVNLGL